MNILLATQKSHTCDESDQTEIMISVQVRNEDMIDLAAPDLIFRNLCLSTFTAIHKEQVLVHRNYLRGRMTVKCR